MFITILQDIFRICIYKETSHMYILYCHLYYDLSYNQQNRIVENIGKVRG